MIIRNLYLIMCIAVPFMSYSQAEEVPDSTATTLDEIVVQGSTGCEIRCRVYSGQEGEEGRV